MLVRELNVVVAFILIAAAVAVGLSLGNYISARVGIRGS